MDELSWIGLKQILTTVVSTNYLNVLSEQKLYVLKINAQLMDVGSIPI